ncbi:FixH family protein [Namhaeicola litoreus]|uniref:FixH family protein n=1 Tax=Namhaeicola litoreus TaxID=1052145 RepID=A0ABW3Y4G6_9FLAO
MKKIKFNWGTGVVVAMILFMIFILQFVYRASAVDKYNHHLVTEDYYGEEIQYQKEIDKENKGNNLVKNIKIVHNGNGLTIQFPDNLPENLISGSISFKRLSNEKLDFILPISNLENHQIYIDDDKLVEGKWQIKIDWSDGKESYLYKESLFY